MKTIGGACVVALVLAVTGGARGAWPKTSTVVAGTAVVAKDGTRACVVDVARDAAVGASVVRACVLATAKEAGALYTEPADKGGCPAGEAASVIVLSSEDDDWVYQTGAKPAGACGVVLTPSPEPDDQGIYECIGIDGARVYILDEDDLIAKVGGDPTKPEGLFGSDGIDGARVYILDEDDRIE